MAAAVAAIVPAQASAASGLSWGPRTLVDPPDGGHRLVAISCPTAQLCATVDSSGNAITSTNPTGPASAWHRKNIDGSALIRGVSCLPALCVAVDGSGNVLTTTNPSNASPSWSAPVAVDAPNSLMAVSCPSSTRCVAVDNAGNVVTSTNPTGGAGSWTAAAVDGSTTIEAVSCPSVSFCVAVDNQGNALSSTNPTGGAAAWKLHGGIDPGNDVQAVSCPSTTLCVAVDDAGNILSTTAPAAGTVWKLAHVETGANEFTTPFGVSCPSTGFCIVVDDAGDALTSTRPTGAAADWQRTHVDARWSFLAVSCARLPLCVGSDQGGNVVAGRLPRPGTVITSKTINKAKHSATFRFRALGVATGLQCKLVRNAAPAAFKGCRSPKAYRKLKAGHYRFLVRALNSTGPDPTPAVATFALKKRTSP